MNTNTETIVSKGQRNGWTASTRFQMGDAKDHFGEPSKRVLHFSTMKSSRGGVFTTARACLERDGMTSFAIFGDYTKTVEQSPARCTEKTVREQHAQALGQAESILAEAHAFYAANELERAAA